MTCVCIRVTSTRSATPNVAAGMKRLADAIDLPSMLLASRMERLCNPSKKLVQLIHTINWRLPQPFC